MKDEWNPAVTGLLFFTYGGFLAWLLTAVGSLSSSNGIAAIGAAIALLNTLVLAYIGYQANRLVMAAHNREAVRERNQRRLVFSMLSQEWQQARIQLGVVQHLLAGELSLATFAGRSIARELAATHVRKISLAQTEAMIDQVHVLPAALVDRVGHAVGTVQNIKRVADNSASLPTPGAWRDELGDYYEPNPPLSEAIEDFSAAHRVLAGGSSLAIDELDALIAAANAAALGRASG